MGRNGSLSTMPSTCSATTVVGAAACVAGGFLLAKALSLKGPKYSDPNQPARFAAQKSANCSRALDIDSHFEPGLIKDKRVLVTGCNRGIGLALVKELVACGADVIGTCRKSTDQLKAMGIQVIEGVDVTSDESMAKLVKEIAAPVDVVINNAGYFKTERESVLEGTMDFDDQVKTIDICAVGILRVSDALFRAGKITEGGKIIMITSQGGSIDWRSVQCPDGGDYGHHMSKAAANMGAVLLANELKGKVAVGIFHPGFNRTEMTSKYSEIWDIEGAVDVSVGAKRILHEVNLLGMETSGQFINCEDGLLIPW